MRRTWTTSETPDRPLTPVSVSSTARWSSRLRFTPKALVALLAVLLLLLGSVPTAAAAPAAPSTPPTPAAPAAAPVPPGAPRGAAPAVRIESPATGSLVSGQPLMAKVWTAAGATKFTATLDERDVTKSFHRIGRTWVGLVNKVPAGVNTLDVSAVVHGKVQRAHTRVTVKGKTADLVSVVPDPSGLLSAAADPGVKPIAVRVDATSTANAWLNGKPVTLSRPSSGTVRSMVLSVRDGLRAGANVFVVQASRKDGTWESLRVPFTIQPGVPLAEAGSNVDSREGDTVALDGGGSKLGSSAGRLTYQWQVLETPTGAGALTLTRSGPKASLRLSKPGQYVVRLTVTERRGGKILRSSDLTVLDALASVPPLGQAITTYDPTLDGLTIGSSTIAWDKYFKGQQAGVYGFNPRTLLFPLVSGSALAPRGLSASDPDGDLKAFLAAVPQGTIVVVVGKDGCCGKSSLLPTSGPFSHIVAYSGPTAPGNFTAGSWNRGLAFGDGSGEPGAAGTLKGFLRYQTGLDQPAQGGGPDGSASGAFRFVQADDVRFATSVPSIATTSTNDGAVYRLGSPGRDVAIAIAGNDQDALSLQPSSGSAGQQWQLVRAYGEFYELVNRSSGRCLVSSTPTAVLQLPCTSSHDPSGLWLPVFDDDSGSYRLRSGTAPTAADNTSANVLSRTGDGAGAGVVLRPLDVSSAQQRWAFEIPPGVYGITAQQTGKAVAEPDYGATPGQQLVSATSTAELGQQWRVLDREYGAFALQNLSSGMCAGFSGTDAGSTVVRTPCDASQKTQWWTPVASGNGLYLQAYGSKLNLAGDGGKLALQAYDKLDPVQPVWALNRRPEPFAGGYYSLVGAGTGKTVQAVGNGQAAARPAAAPLAGQDWQLRPTRWNETTYATLTNPRTGQCLNVLGQGVVVGDCADPNQDVRSMWRLAAQPDGTYRIEFADVPPAAWVLTAQDDGSLVTVGDTGAPNQRWLFAGAPVSFQVAGQRYATSLPAGGSGFSVLATDTATRPLDGYPKLYVTNGASGSNDAQTALADDLKKLGGTGGVTVLVQSVGRPKPNGLTWNAIADGVAAIGGDKTSLLSMNGTGDVAVAGCGKCGDRPTYNELIRRGVDPTVVGARLEGTMVRDGQGTLVPQQATAARVDDTFDDLAGRGLTAWPFADKGSTPGQYAVLQAIATMLTLPATCGTDTGLDPVRRSYCLWQDSEAQNWTGYRLTLNQKTYTDFTKPNFSQTDFDTVKAQLNQEWTDLSAVHEMMQGQRDHYSEAIFTNQHDAQSVAATIKAQLPPKRTSKNETGGILELITEAYTLIKPLAPLVLAGPQAGPDEPEKGEVSDLVDIGLGFAGDMIKLAGDNNDSSSGVATEIDTDALSYAGELDAQNGKALGNVSTVENMVLTDPVKLGLAAANSTQKWDLPADQLDRQREDLAAGVSRDLWNKLFPVAYEMWQWPSLPAGYQPTDIACKNTTYVVTPTYHPIYAGQANSGAFQLPTAYDAAGNVTHPRTLLLTANVDPFVGDNVDRLLRPDLANALYAGTGYAPEELVARLPADRRNYPDDMELTQKDAQANYCLVIRNGTKANFGPSY